MPRCCLFSWLWLISATNLCLCWSHLINSFWTSKELSISQEIMSPQNIMTTTLHKQRAPTKGEHSVHYCRTTMSWNNSMIGSKQADKQLQPTLEPAWFGKLVVCRRRNQAQAFPWRPLLVSADSFGNLGKPWWGRVKSRNMFWWSVFNHHVVLQTLCTSICRLWVETWSVCTEFPVIAK